MSFNYHKLKHQIQMCTLNTDFKLYGQSLTANFEFKLNIPKLQMSCFKLQMSSIKLQKSTPPTNTKKLQKLSSLNKSFRTDERMNTWVDKRTNRVTWSLLELLIASKNKIIKQQVIWGLGPPSDRCITLICNDKQNFIRLGVRVVYETVVNYSSIS